MSHKYSDKIFFIALFLIGLLIGRAGTLYKQEHDLKNGNLSIVITEDFGQKRVVTCNPKTNEKCPTMMSCDNF